MKRTLFYLLTLAICTALCLCLFSCGDKNTSQSNESAPSHTDDTISKEIPTLEYELSEDGSFYKVTGIGTYTDYDLIIPEEHEGKPVKEIDSGAFIDCLSIVRVIIPDTITTVSYNAFSNCLGIVSVTIGKNVNEIKYNAFKNCHKLIEVINNSPSITVANDDSNGSIGLNALSISNSDASYKSLVSIQDNGYIIYDNGTVRYLMGSVGTINRITVDQDFSAIYKYAFYKNQNVVWLDVSGDLSSIGEHAFAYCYNLVSTILRGAVQEIGDKAFYECPTLAEVVSMVGPKIERNKSNGWLGLACVNNIIFNSGDKYESPLTCTDDGFIILKYGSTRYLLGYVGDKTELIIPEDVTEIFRYSFYNNDKIKSVSFGKRVRSLGSYAFANCTSLENVDFWRKDLSTRPSIDGNEYGIREIGSYTFYGCTGLKEIFLPETIRFVYEKAFVNCDGLSIYCEFEYYVHGSVYRSFDNNWKDYTATVYAYSKNNPYTSDSYLYNNYWHYDDNKNVIIWAK